MLLDWIGTMEVFHTFLFQWNDLQQLLLGGFRLEGCSVSEVSVAIGRP
jgi:hypothetical protein